nr:MAG TPA: hypothetical protein [Caudoviricetes sp.]
MEKRKGYKKSEEQVAANNRYLKNNKEAREKKKISNYKSNAKNFILKYANLEDLKEIESFIKKRENVIKKSSY